MSVALLIHPNPDDELLESVLSICGNLVLLIPKTYADKQFRGRNANITRYTYAPDEDVIELATRLGRAHRIDVVPSVWEGMVESIAAITGSLGLAGNPLSAAQRSRDKYLAALCFERHQVPHANTKLYDVATDQPTVIEKEAEYPFIVKLPRSTNSHSVTLIRSRGELCDALDGFRRLYQPDSPNRLYGLYRSMTGKQPFLVQDYVAGCELNIDLLYNASDHCLLGVFEKYPMTGPTFEEVQSVYPVTLSQEDLNSCICTALAAVRALGAVNGAAHVELRMSDKGPVVIEAALRPGGFYTPRAIGHLTGINPISALTRMLLDNTLPELDALPKGRACLYGAVNIAREGRISSISGDDFASRIPNVLAFELLKRPGDRITPLPAGTDYHVARFILAGDCRKDLESTAESIRRSLTVELEAVS